jgi:hypothetical protein
MRDHNDFYENLDFAQEGEREVAALLERKLPGIKILDSNNNGKSHDIEALLEGRKVLFEVKEDVRASDTGNVVIECESRGKPSGIRTTKADFWLFRIHKEDGSVDTLGFKVSTLKDMIRKRLWFNKRQMQHTDSCNLLYFFKRDVLDEFAQLKW